MNWITTNIRFPEEMYMELKMEAAKKRKSVAALVRESLSKARKQKASRRNNTAKLIREFNKIAKENSRQNPGISFSEKLIEMRYEQ